MERIDIKKSLLKGDIKEVKFFLSPKRKYYMTKDGKLYSQHGSLLKGYRNLHPIKYSDYKNAYIEYYTKLELLLMAYRPEDAQKIHLPNRYYIHCKDNILHADNIIIDRKGHLGGYLNNIELIINLMLTHNLTKATEVARYISYKNLTEYRYIINTTKRIIKNTLSEEAKGIVIRAKERFENERKTKQEHSCCS